MPVTHIQHTAAWREVLTLSKLKAGERVVILTSVNSNPDLIAAATHAASDLGAVVVRLDIPPVFDLAQLGTDPTAVTGASPIDGNPVAIEAMKAADLVIDLVFLLFTPGQKEVLASGTRMLLAYEDPETLVRLVPTEDDRRRVLAAKAAFHAGRTMRVTSAAGTDLRAEIGDNPITAEYGYVDEPGRWDHWPSGFVARVPNRDTAEGTVVLAPGDIILPFKSYVQSPINLTIEKGLITRIEGGFEADFMRQYIEDFNEPDAFAISHLGWGLQKRARWTAMGLYDKHPTIGMEGRAFAGNFLFSTGPGNGRKTRCHLDIPMRNCSFFVDDVPMTRDGRVIPSDQIAN
ncbi:2,5-dihydroxypyridine 5,6-dioxygenase [Acuticoccus kandeliae]|uniref:2,5-dihydroxypyridine 5,6-dioxygenase n=1 Tax=Acuticoccus kandeliae TaxID=2073160 RepID=UPI000D3E76CE|nr:2,5-dihydroxypyridine 5,6-dioxygenase [Acuticoccus kandeliae]